MSEREAAGSGDKLYVCEGLVRQARLGRVKVASAPWAGTAEAAEPHRTGVSLDLKEAMGLELK